MFDILFFLQGVWLIFESGVWKKGGGDNLEKEGIRPAWESGVSSLVG